MRLFQVVAFVLLVTGTCFGQEWGEYVNRDEMFVVAFPGQPTVQNMTFKSELEKDLPAKVFNAQAGPSRYKITVVNYKDAEVGDVRGSVAWAAWLIRKRGGDIQHDGFNANDRIEGHQLHVLNPDKTRTLVAIHQYARRLYILEATTPADYPPGADFQQSLVILDGEGKRVRYDLDEDGNRTKRVPSEAYVPGAD
jgi:hypothetical protein